MDDKYTIFSLKLILALFVLLNVYAVFNYPFQNKESFFLNFYNSFALPGPFFSEERIKIIPHYAYRIKSKHSWGEWKDPERDNFLSYHQNPLLYTKLQQSNFERSLTRQLSRKVNKSGVDSIEYSRELKALYRYLTEEYSIEKYDSIQMVFVLETYTTSGIVKVDTTFRLSFSNTLR